MLFPKPWTGSLAPELKYDPSHASPWAGATPALLIGRSACVLVGRRVLPASDCTRKRDRSALVAARCSAMANELPWPSASLSPFCRNSPMLNSGDCVCVPVDARTLRLAAVGRRGAGREGERTATHRDSMRPSDDDAGTPASCRCFETTLESTCLGLRILKRCVRST